MKKLKFLITFLMINCFFFNQNIINVAKSTEVSSIQLIISDVFSKAKIMETIKDIKVKSNFLDADNIEIDKRNTNVAYNSVVKYIATSFPSKKINFTEEEYIQVLKDSSNSLSSSLNKIINEKEPQLDKDIVRHTINEEIWPNYASEMIVDFLNTNTENKISIILPPKIATNINALETIAKTSKSTSIISFLQNLDDNSIDPLITEEKALFIISGYHANHVQYYKEKLKEDLKKPEGESILRKKNIDANYIDFIQNTKIDNKNSEHQKMLETIFGYTKNTPIETELKQYLLKENNERNINIRKALNLFKQNNTDILVKEYSKLEINEKLLTQLAE